MKLTWQTQSWRYEHWKDNFLYVTFLVLNLLISLFLAYILFYIPIKNYLGYCPRGYFERYEQAMLQRDGKAAVYWINRTGAYKTNFIRQHFSMAYEMAGDFEKAVLVLDGVNEHMNMGEARRLYKQNQRKKSFEKYCEYVHLRKKEWGEYEPYSPCFLEDLRDDVMCRYSFKTLCPYKTYDDFLAFMEEEYEKSDKLKESTSAMNIYRQTKTGIRDGGIRKFRFDTSNKGICSYTTTSKENPGGESGSGEGESGSGVIVSDNAQDNAITQDRKILDAVY